MARRVWCEIHTTNLLPLTEQFIINFYADNNIQPLFFNYKLTYKRHVILIAEPDFDEVHACT